MTRGLILVSIKLQLNNLILNKSDSLDQNELEPVLWDGIICITKNIRDIFVFLFLNDYLIILSARATSEHTCSAYARSVWCCHVCCVWTWPRGALPLYFLTFFLRAQQAKESFTLSPVSRPRRSCAGTPLTATFLPLGQKSHSRMIVSSEYFGFVLNTGDAKRTKGEMYIMSHFGRLVEDLYWWL